MDTDEIMITVFLNVTTVSRRVNFNIIMQVANAEDAKQKPNLAVALSSF